MITSRHNSRIRWLRSLSDKKVRHAENVVVLEGLRLVEDVMSLGTVAPRLVVYSGRLLETERGRRLAELIEEVWPGTGFQVTDDVLAAAAETETPQGVITVVPAPARDWTEYLAGLDNTQRKAAGGGGGGEASVCIMALDGVGDPGNVGTAIRSACGAGLAGVLVGPGCADPGGGKAVRASMGALFRAPVFVVPDLAGALELGRRNGFRVIGAMAAPSVAELDATASGGSGEAVRVTNLWEKDLSGRIALVVGSEAVGISAPVARVLESGVTIPLSGGVESLNAGVAASILAFEFARRRGGKP